VDFTPAFQDQRLPEMLFRYRARNYPETLTADERLRWDAFRHDRLQSPEVGTGLSMSAYTSIVNELRQSVSNSQEGQNILNALDDYVNSIVTGVE
jgi:exodeoxyribonuclease-1